MEEVRNRKGGRGYMRCDGLTRERCGDVDAFGIECGL